MYVLAIALLAVTTPLSPHRAVHAAGDPARATVRIEQRHNDLMVTIGPFRIPPTMSMHDMDMMVMQHRESLVGVFNWPETRRFHGIRLAVVDAQGEPMARALLHHTYMVNFDRRQLALPIMERTFSFGEETADVSVPATIGMPVAGGQRMGIVIMWNNETGHDVDGAYVRYTFALNPVHQHPRQMDVMPFTLDVNHRVGATDTFSVAPGGRTLTSQFVLPAGGHVIAASGHLHDHAVGIKIQQVRTGRTLLTITANRNEAGIIHGVSREIPGLWGSGPHLAAGEPYRLVVEYDNPTADTLHGAMGLLGGIIVLDHPDRWPALDRSDPMWLADLAGYAGAAELLATLPERAIASRETGRGTRD